MSIQEIKEVENILRSHLVQRFSDKDLNYIKLFFGVERKSKYADAFLAALIGAFARCIFNVEDEIYLKDIATIILAESNYISGQTTSYLQKKMTTQLRWKNAIESEIHIWMLLLQEKNKLPGIYERFTGRFKKRS